LLSAQTISNVWAEVQDSKVAVHYELKTNLDTYIVLQYSDDNGRTWQQCKTISGDLHPQNSGNKTIMWNCIVDEVFNGAIFFKVSIDHERTAREHAAREQAARDQAARENMNVTVNGVTFEMVHVQGGTFMMGCTAEQGSDCFSDEKPAHQVTVSSFNIGKYEVTQAQWKAVMGNNPSYFKGDNLPVENVSWDDVQEFISKLNAKTGKKYRLPTEAEWEFAARGGNSSKGYMYSGSNTLSNVAWYEDNSGEKTHPVGSKQPNELGIYDMSGNVYEWCSDWYGVYTSAAQTNPKGASSGSYRVLRGGSWYNTAVFCRVARGSYNIPGGRNRGYGLRLVVLP